MMSEEEKLLKEAKRLPWGDRLSHKNWKVRNDANVDLAALLASIADPKDPRLRDFGSFFKKTVADSNAAVQEKVLDALIAFLRAADADVARYAKEVCDAMVAKCLVGRPKTVEKSRAAFLLWVELEAAEMFLDSMEKAIKSKVAKAVVSAVDVMFQALNEFGSKIVAPKRILKILPELFDHQDQNVRASSKGLTLELCRWIGKDAVRNILFEKMRDTMKKELETELVNVITTAKPTRKIRSEQDRELEQEVSDVGASVSSDGNVVDFDQEIDEYELVDPVDVLPMLEKIGFWEGVKATKWSERKNAVAELTRLCSVKKIAPGDFSEVCRLLKKLIADDLVAVAIEAIHAVQNLAKGLRKNFYASSRFLLPVLLQKLKEKKLATHITQTLQSMHKFGCLTLADVIEDVKEAMKNKVPHVRSFTLGWTTFCFETSKKAAILKLYKDYVPICMEALTDGIPEVRDAAFSALTAIAKLVGVRALERSLEKLDDIRKKKLFDMIGASMDGLSCGTAPAQHLISKGNVSHAVNGDHLIVKKSAASMLAERKVVQQTVAVERELGDTKGGAGNCDPSSNKSHGPPSKSSPRAGKVSPPNPALKNVHKPSSPRNIGLPLSKRGVVSPFENVAAPLQPLFNIKDSNKENREKKIMVRFKFEEPRFEQSQDFERNIARYFKEGLHRRLLSSDFRKHVEGLDLLHKALASCGKEIIELLDLLLQWLALRLCESNTTCLLKVLTFFPTLFEVLKTEKYTLSEPEVALFLPSLIEKSGHKNQVVKEKMRGLLKQIISIYSASKLFPFIIEGMRSKNSRTKIECMHLVGYLIDQHASEINGQLKSLKVVVKLAAGRDGELKNAALNTMAIAHKTFGENVWKHVGKLSDAQMSVIDDKFRGKALDMDKRKEVKVSKVRPALRRIQ